MRADELGREISLGRVEEEKDGSVPDREDAGSEDLQGSQEPTVQTRSGKEPGNIETESGGQVWRIEASSYAGSGKGKPASRKSV